jgi:hypothetical protein
MKTVGSLNRRIAIPYDHGCAKCVQWVYEILVDSKSPYILCDVRGCALAFTMCADTRIR